MLCCSLLMSLTTFSQTKLISHKSHSGKSENFHKAMLFHNDLAFSDFGVAPQPIVKYAKLDTLKYISDSVSVMITSHFCDDLNTLRRIRRLKQTTDSLPSTIEQMNTEDQWSAGIDTLYNHPLFSKKESLDSIKKVLKENYYFKNNIDSVQFIGYSSVNKITIKENKKESIPPIYYSKTKPKTPIKVIGLFIISLLALIIGFMYYKIQSKKKILGKI